jgi:hypothetical protein
MADDIVTAYKRCGKCGETKRASEFYRQKDTEDGLRSQCKICYAGANRNYYSRNREDVLKCVKSYRDAHAPEIADWHRIYRSSNSDRITARKSVYYAVNRDVVLEKNRAYKKSHCAEVREANHRRRAVELSAEGNFSAKDWVTLVEKSPRCHWCKRKWSGKRKPTHDHVIPLTKGGLNSLENSVCSCSSCNSSKRDRLVNPITKAAILL